MPGFDPTSVSADHWMYARTLFDNYNVETIQSIFEHLSSTQSAAIHSFIRKLQAHSNSFQNENQPYLSGQFPVARRLFTQVAVALRSFLTGAAYQQTPAFRFRAL
jgi:hypothetical protein